MDPALFERIGQQSTAYLGERGKLPTFSPPRKTTRSIDSESPIADFDEELFHLEMSDEGSGGKRSKLDHDIDHMPRLVSQDYGFMVQPQKRGAVQPLGASASNMTTKKARRTAAESKLDAKQKWIKSQQQTMMEEEDADPQMARAAVYYLLVLEDQLVAKNFYDGKNRIHSKSISITIQHRRKLLDWLFRVNMQFSFQFDTWVLTASILDRFLSAQPIEKDVFQLAGCAAFLISAKHEERFPPKISELVDICARCYNKIDFLKMEQIMLLVLEWNILTPTVNVLVREVSLIQNPVRDFNPNFLTNLIKKVIFHKNLAYMPPSKVAFSLISASDHNAEVEDVEKTFKYLLYLLKQDPDEHDDDFTY
jgi:hypothetical protein